MAPNSQTPTFAALRLFVDNWRWQGVPFYLRAGKCLAERKTEIAIFFHAVPFCLFGDEQVCRKLSPNVLTLRIQPHESITLSFMIKPPGNRLDVLPVAMKHCYHCEFGYDTPEAYERLILDSFQGDQTLFVRSDAVVAQWRVIAPVLQVWQQTQRARFSQLPPRHHGDRRRDDRICLRARWWQRWWERSVTEPMSDFPVRDRGARRRWRR